MPVVAVSPGDEATAIAPDPAPAACRRFRVDHGISNRVVTSSHKLMEMSGEVSSLTSRCPPSRDSGLGASVEPRGMTR
jgi:hypothetical protein